MDELVAAIILAFVQGVTEWLPISSSGHLVLFENILGYRVGLALEVALHFGTLMAIFVYFGKDIIAIIEDILKGRWQTENARTGFYVALATVPVVFVGLLIEPVFDSFFS